MRVVHVRRDALARTGGLHSNDATPDDPVTTHEMDRRGPPTRRHLPPVTAREGPPRPASANQFRGNLDIVPAEA